MAQQVQISKPQRINLDKARKYLSPEEASYILNGDSSTVPGKSIPLAANSPLCEIEQPDGENYTIGTYYSPLTNETYSWTYNSNGVNYLQRINGEGACEIVYSGECLDLSAAPEHGIFDWRAKMRLEKICHNRAGKELIWVDGTDNDIYCLDVEASIATNFFTTPFFDRCPDPCAPLKLCVPDICGCINGEFAPLATGQESLTNHLIDVGVKIIVRHIYYDQRASEWSIPSTLFYQDVKGGCFGGATGFSRCLKLTIPLGNPLVDKIEIGYSIDNGANWLLSDTIEKYASYTSATQFWYERGINPELALTEDGCSFYYFFCNDKQCQPIDPKEVARVYNPLPRAPQGMIEIKDGLGFYNYKQGNCPIDKVETDKFKVGLDCVNDSDCVTEYVTVTVRAIIHNIYDQTNEFIYREKGNYNRYGGGDDETDPAYFGGFVRNAGLPYYTTFDQTFAANKRNFTVYIEGTDYSEGMRQYRAYQNFTHNKLVDIISGFGNEGVRDDVFAIIDTGFYYYQEAVIKVPKGTRGFLRMSSHKSSFADPNTSTYVLGTINDIHQYVSIKEDLPPVNREFEIYFDTCNGSVDLTKAFIINDNAETETSKAVNGVVIDNSGAPLASVEIFSGNDAYLCRTDHNGFYHFNSGEATSPLTVKVYMEVDCDTFGFVQTDAINTVAGRNIRKDIRVTNDNYVRNWLANALVHVIDCDGNDVAGIPVAVSGAKFRYTDENGLVRVPIRNFSTRNRLVRVVVMDAKGCFLLDCDGKCNPCFFTDVQQAPACFSVVHAQPQIMDFGTAALNVKQKSLTNRGLKKSGRYGFGIVAMGDCGRISSVYESGYVNIPRFQENSSEDFCSFTYNANGIKLPEWVKCLQVVRTENLNPFELQWLVDKIERTGDGKIILTIQSLNDYNERYAFKTNTIYQYQQGDRIEFISNGDGKVFSTQEHGVLNYVTLSPFNDQELSKNTDADFFNQLIIQDDGKLNELVAGAKIELQRAKTCTTDPVYYSICTSLKVEDGQVVEQTGSFETFDTFRVTRQIGNFSPQSFEHFAPSDFWINKVNDQGKPYFVNKYENERRYGRNISLNSPTQFNRFGDAVKTIEAPLQGDLVALNITDAKIVFGICENDSFVLSVADDLLRVTSEGIAALPADRIIGDPQAGFGAQYGCRYQDAGSVHFGDSAATWADVKRDAYVKYNYGLSRDAATGKMVSDISANQFKSYLKQKFRNIEIANAAATDDLDKFRFITGSNKINSNVFLTIKSLRDADVNNEQAPLLKRNETLVINPLSGELLTFASFTPEAYSNLNINDTEGCAFIAYSKGVPFLHPIVASKWNEFFGIACDRVVAISVNKFPEKIKVAIAIEVQDETMWYVSKVVTDNPNYLSEIPPVRWEKQEDKWNSSFLGNKNSRLGLYGREQPRGYFTEVTFIRDNSINLQYKSVNSAKQITYDELDEIIFKLMVSEQSGFSENL